MKKPHGSAVLEMRRYASFIATSNQKDLLTDPSGSRRFICIEVTGVIDTNRPIDYEPVSYTHLKQLRQECEWKVKELKWEFQAKMETVRKERSAIEEQLQTLDALIE